MKNSIITPCYNSAGFLQRGIDSVLKQNCPDFEHIIVDAGSTDGTLDILKKNIHIKWISEPDKGQFDAMNKGFTMSTGEIIVYLNADDEFVPGILNKIVYLFQHSNNEKKTMVITDLTIIDKNGNESITKPSSSLKNILNPDQLNFPYNPVSYFYHRNVQESIGEIPALHLAMDYWFLLRAYTISTIIYFPEVGGIFHNYNNKTADNIRSEIECLEILMDFVKNKKKLTYFLDSNWRKARKKKNLFKAKL